MSISLDLVSPSRVPYVVSEIQRLELGEDQVSLSVSIGELDGLTAESI